FGVGLVVAIIGAAVAARRAGKVRPIGALREASVDRRVMTAGRWVFGLLFLGGAGVVLAIVPGLGGDAVALVLLDAQLAIVGVALLAPVLAPGVAWLVGRPLPGVTAALARDNTRTATRRTAATVAPILVTVGIAAATLAATGTLFRAEERSAADRVTAAAIAVPAGPSGRVDETAGVPVAWSVVYVRQDDYVEEFDAVYAGAGLDRVMRVPAVRPGEMVVGDALARSAGWRPGGTAEFWLDDTTPVRVTVGAVLPPSLDLDRAVLLPWSLRPAGTRTDAVYLTGTPAPGVTAVTPERYFAAQHEEQRRMNNLALLAILGMALVYTSIAIVNTLVMATGDRARDLAVLRLAGTTPRQVLVMIGVEALLTGLTGVLLAGAVTGAMLTGLLDGLRRMAASAELVVPWTPVLAVTGCCLVVTLAGSLVPAALALRVPAARTAGLRE
ncbi:ABC transporter permease, partial [Dactylosporangium fulvum]|uniref:ABC transporter permease n=1 Tax=Dactylosporangium fulvum TaxID=53359 RepID=UPI0031DC73E4